MPKIKITNNTFVSGKMHTAGEILEVSGSDYKALISAKQGEAIIENIEIKEEIPPQIAPTPIDLSDEDNEEAKKSRSTKK